MKKVLKVLGWISIPYVMLLIFWKKLNKPGKIAGIIYSVLIIISAIVNGSTGDNNSKSTSQTVESSSSNDTANQATAAKKSTDTNNAAANQKSQAEAEAKKKADEEAAAKKKADEEAAAQKAAQEKANEIQPGTYQVGVDVQPGLYRTDDEISYWARLKGLSGDLGEILANGNPQGSAVVEILPTDKAFETQGSGVWHKVDDTYQPQIQTSFGDGTYFVGKDISPGTYKSNGGGYWSRLSGFSGDMSQILANGNPQGQTIVQILPSDKGFETSGNGTWTKIQ